MEHESSVDVSSWFRGNLIFNLVNKCVGVVVMVSVLLLIPKLETINIQEITFILYSHTHTYTQRMYPVYPKSPLFVTVIKRIQHLSWR